MALLTSVLALTIVLWGVESSNGLPPPAGHTSAYRTRSHNEQGPKAIPPGAVQGEGSVEKGADVTPTANWREPVVWRQAGPGSEAIAAYLNATVVDPTLRRLLFADEFRGYFVELIWDAATSKLVIDVDGNNLGDLDAREDKLGRMSFHHAAAAQQPELDGFLTLEMPAQGDATLLVQISVDGQYSRIALPQETIGTSPVPGKDSTETQPSTEADAETTEIVADSDEGEAATPWYESIVWVQPGPGCQTIRTHLSAAAPEPGSVWTLWEGMLNGLWVEFQWNASASELAVAIDGAPVDDLLQFDDPNGRLGFTHIANETAPEIDGFLLTDPSGAFVLIQAAIGGHFYRVGWPLAIAGDVTAGGYPTEGEPGPSEDCSKSTCICFGVGTSNYTCTSTDCDVSKKCGSGSKHCRWKAGCAE